MKTGSRKQVTSDSSVGNMFSWISTPYLVASLALFGDLDCWTAFNQVGESFLHSLLRSLKMLAPYRICSALYGYGAVQRAEGWMDAIADQSSRKVFRSLLR